MRHRFRDRALRDGLCHKRRVRKWYTEENLSGLLTPDVITLQDAAKGIDGKINLPVPAVLRDYHFVMEEENEQGVTQGPGSGSFGDAGEEVGQSGSGDSSSEGDSAESESGKLDFSEDGTGSGAGTNVGEPETDVMSVTKREILRWLFEDVLEFPFLEDIGRKILESSQIEHQPRQKSTSLSGILPKEMLREWMKRNFAETDSSKSSNEHDREVVIPHDIEFTEWDIVTTTSEEEKDPGVEVVLYLVMDRTGSMGKELLAMLKVFFFYLVELIRLWHGVETIEVICIRFTTEAELLTSDRESEFWETGASGGTKISVGLEKALEHMQDSKRHSGRRNAYLALVSDGLNIGSTDNNHCADVISRLMSCCRQVMYIEVSNSPRSSDIEIDGAGEPRFLRDALRRHRQIWNHPRFVSELMWSNKQLQDMVMKFFRVEEELEDIT